MKSVKFPDIELIETEAAQWIAKVDRGLSGDEELELSSWLEESPANAEMLIKCASMWDLLDVLAPIAKLMPMDALSAVSDATTSTTAQTTAQQKPNGDLPKVSTINKPLPLWAAALAVVSVGVLMLTGLPSQLRAPQNSPSVVTVPEKSVNPDLASPAKKQVYKTAIGEISKVTLADGSKLQLNTDSVVTVQLFEQTRQLELLSGEVFFDVAKDPSRPFVVNVGSDQVVAVGTAFNIDARPSLNSADIVTEVIVTEGKVKVTLNTDNPDAASASKGLFLTPGQSVRIMGDKPEIKDQRDTETLLAWREGMLIFQGEPLEQAVAEIDRYTALRLTIVDEQIAKIPVGGFFKTGDTEQLLLVLEQNFGVHSTQIGDEVLLHAVR